MDLFIERVDRALQQVEKRKMEPLEELTPEIEANSAGEIPWNIGDALCLFERNKVPDWIYGVGMLHYSRDCDSIDFDGRQWLVFARAEDDPPETFEDEESAVECLIERIDHRLQEIEGRSIDFDLTWGGGQAGKD